MTNHNEYSIGKFTALETAIANGEEDSVKQLLTQQPMQDLEKSYLIELAQLSNNPIIIKLLKDTPIKE